MQHYQDPGVLNQRKIFVGGLTSTTSENSLRKYFEKHGELTDCCVMVDRDSKPRGFGFVTFRDKSSLTAVMATTHMIDNK